MWQNLTETSPPRTIAVQLPRPDDEGPTLLITPLPLGFSRRLRQHGVVPPQAPTRVARDSQGRPLRQPNGQAVLLTEEQDAGYLAEYELYHQRVAVLSIAEALRHDPQFACEELRQADHADWRELADQLQADLEAAGWVAGDVVWLCTHICRLSNLLDTDLAETAADFSSAAGRKNPCGTACHNRGR